MKIGSLVSENVKITYLEGVELLMPIGPTTPGTDTEDVGIAFTPVSLLAMGLL